MISKIRYPDGRTYICDDCKKEIKKFTNYDNARAAGWAVSWERTYCYCPACAPAHRLGGANGKHTKPKQWLPKGFEQIKIDI